MQIQKETWVVLIALLVFSASKAQQGRDLPDFLIIKLTEKHLYGGPEERIEGTPYLEEAYRTSYITFRNEKVAEVSMRYNIYNDQFEFQQDNSTLGLNPDATIKRIKMGDYIFSVENLNPKGKPKIGFVIVLDSGRVSLLQKRTITLTKKDDLHAIPARYTKGKDFLLYKIGNGEVMKIESMKKLISNFPAEQEIINHFIKKEKLSSNKEDFIRFVKYYNSL